MAWPIKFGANLASCWCIKIATGIIKFIFCSELKLVLQLSVMRQKNYRLISRGIIDNSQRNYSGYLIRFTKNHIQFLGRVSIGDFTAPHSVSY